MRVALLLLLSLSIAVGCETAPETAPGEAQPARLEAIQQDLDLGSSGEGVRAVHAYLTAYGYFPNDAIAEKHPGWAPLVASAPALDDVFDEHSQEAVMAFQRNIGLDDTGIVDADTRAAMLLPRCGNPDGSEPFELIEKYAFSTVNPKITQAFIRWQLVGTSDFVTRAQTEAAITAALNTWAQTTALTFLKAAPGEVPQIRIAWGQVADPTHVFAETIPDPAAPETHVVTLESSWHWSVANPTAASSVDLQSILVHELGHAIGIAHSSLASTVVMWPSIAKGQQRRSLQQEDAVPASVLYDTWEVASSANTARDIAVSKTGALWIIGNSCAFGGCAIQKWNGTGWDTADSVALRIAIDPSSVPWIVGPTGNIYKRSGPNATSGSWTQIPGCAKDIAIGDNFAVWILGCESAFGGFSIKKLNPTTQAWETADGVAVRVAVGPSGIPIAITPTGAIVVRSSTSATSGSWGKVIDLGAAPTANTDMAIDQFGYLYVVGASDRIKVLGQNNAGASTVFVNQLFSLFADGTRAITAGLLPAGTTGVWSVSTDGVIKRPTK